MSWLTDNIKEYLAETVRFSDYTLREMTEDLEHIVDEYEKDYSPYRWHDLRKNPEDLPEERSHVICCHGGKRKYYTATWFCKNAFWCADEEYGSFPYEDVIAWRYIEPFEEVEG